MSHGRYIHHGKMDTLHPVVWGAEVRSWPRHAEGGGARPTRLADALTKHYAFDAHIAQYECPAVHRRLGAEALTDQSALEKIGGAVRMVALILDVDGPGHEATVGWWADQRPRAEATGTAWYRTRGGYRLVWRLAEPYEIRTDADVQGWRIFVASAVAYLRRVHGIEADLLHDWQRLMRLPRATRDGVALDPEMGGVVAVWSPDLTPSDAVAARRMLGPKSAARREAAQGPVPFTGRGLIYNLCYGRGLIVRPHGRDAWIIRCPRESEHSSSSDSGTVLYDGAIGHIHCLHSRSGHDRWTVDEMLACFSADELARAQDESGVHLRRLREAEEPRRMVRGAGTVVIVGDEDEAAARRALAASAGDDEVVVVVPDPARCDVRRLCAGRVVVAYPATEGGDAAARAMARVLAARGIRSVRQTPRGAETWAGVLPGVEGKAA